jgi:hypothetical protein
MYICIFIIFEIFFLNYNLQKSLYLKIMRLKMVYLGWNEIFRYIFLILFFNIFILFFLAIGITNSKDITNKFNDQMCYRSGIILLTRHSFIISFLTDSSALGFYTSNAWFSVGRTWKKLTSDLYCPIKTVIL